MSFLNENENELVMESMVSCETKVGEKVSKALTEKKVSKTLTMNEKRAMYGILSFLVIVNRDGLLDDAKTQELMEHLPIFGTVAEKKLYLSQEMFDMKQIETDILKPMVLEHNQRKKEEKKKGKVSVKKSEGEVKEKKKRVYKKKEEVKEEGEEAEVKEKKKRVYKKKEEVKEEGEVKEEEGEEVEVKVEVKEKKKRVYKKKEEVKEEAKEEVKEKKRGRKAKEQIVECKVDVNVNEGNSQEDQLAALVNQLTNPNDIDVDDLDNLLSDMQEEEEEIKKLPETPRLPVPVPEPVLVAVPVPVTKEKAQKKKTSKKNKE